MEETVKMSIKNEDGKTIVKSVPKNLCSLYQGIGWKLEDNKPIVKEKEEPIRENAVLNDKIEYLSKNYNENNKNKSK